MSWPQQDGSVLPSMHRWESRTYPALVRGLALALVVAEESIEDAHDSVEPVPPFCSRWMPGLQPEPVETFVRASAAPHELCSGSIRLPAFSFAAQMSAQVPPPRSQWITGQPAEPAERFVTAALAAHIPCVATPQAFSMAVPATIHLPAPSAEWMHAPQAEPAERMVIPSLSAVFASNPAVVRLRALELAPEHEALDLPEETGAVPAACEAWMPGLAAEPVALMVWPTVGEPFFTDISLLLRGSGVPYTLPALPKPQGPLPCVSAMPVPPAEPAARLIFQSASGNVVAPSPESVPEFTLSPVLASQADDETFAEPPLCEAWMRAPEPELALRFVRSSSVGESFTGIAAQPPVLTLAIADTYVPSTAMLRPVPRAEPVMAGVWPRVADTPLNLMSGIAPLSLPDIAVLSPSVETAGPAPRPEVAASAIGAAPAPVETWLEAAACTAPAMAARAYRLPSPAPPALVAGRPLPGIAGPMIGAPPMGVESLLVSSAATALAPYRPAVQMQAFALAASADPTAPGFEEPALRPAPSAPKRPNNVVVLRPMWTISVAQPEHRSSGPQPTLPKPGFIPLEYHAQRMRGEPVCQLPWQTPNLNPAPPRFTIRPLFDRLEEDLAAQKPARKEPSFADVFTMPEAKKRPSRMLGFAGKAIAAGLVIGGMWLGTSVVRLSRQAVVSRQNDFSNPAAPVGLPNLASGTRTAVATAGPTEAKGPVAWMRRVLSDRATFQAGDNFRDGMQAWGTAPKTYAAGWQRNRDGYVHLGQLALFTPSLKLSDYRFEFFGEVEKNGMGWAVRAKDSENYYAVKVKVLEAGLRPIIAVIRYPVIGGQAGNRVETPLNVMVHNNKPFQVAVNVKGNRFSASIEGEEVDSWSDNRLSSGGVGFFAEAGDSARLYWMKVTRNDDWLGHVCNMLTGGESGTRVTSELWGPGFGESNPGDPQPARIPQPGAPAGAGDVTLAAAGLGLPGFKAQRSRNSKHRRDQSWNS